MQPQPDRGLNFSEKMRMMENLMVFPALSVMVLLRKNLGYRLLNPGWLGGVALFLFVIGGLATGTPNHGALQWFAGLVLWAGLVQRLRRWRDLRRGVVAHSYYIGDSRLLCRWFPAFLRRNRRFTRFFDTSLCILGGVFLLEPCRPLGLWLLLSGFALRVLESRVLRRSRERDLDTVDSMIESEEQTETVEEFIERPRQNGHPQGAAGSIPTGLSPDLERLVKKRHGQSLSPAGLSSALTASQRFWRIFWGRHVWNWWQCRKQRQP